MEKRTPGDKPKKVDEMPRNGPLGQTTGNPGWASGLRQLYDSVVDEPLPDAFKDLLSKLDAKN